MPTIGKNIGLSIFTFVNRMISGSVVYIVLARLMSLNDFGLLAFGTTLAGLLTVVAEFGFSLMAQRDIPQERFDFKLYFVNVFLQKGIFSLLALVGGIIYLALFYSGTNITIGILFAINAVITSYNMYLFAVFRAKNMFNVESWLTAVYSISLVILVIVYYVFKLDVVFITTGLLSARLLQLVIVTIIGHYKFKPVFKFSKEIQVYLFKNSFSFGAHYILGIFYFSIDNQLIAYFCGNESLAIYQAIFRIVLVLLSVNALLEGVFLPYLSAKYKNNPEGFVQLASIINKLFISMGLCIFVFFSLFAFDVVLAFYGEKYLAALSITLPLALILILRSFTSVYSQLLTISDHQNLRVVIAVISLLVNVVLNVFIIPKYNFIGAAYVSLATHLVLVLLYVIFSYRVFSSFLLSKNILLFSLLTIAAVVWKSVYNIELNNYLKAVVIICWMLGLVFVFGKNQITEIRNLVTNKYN